MSIINLYKVISCSIIIIMNMIKTKIYVPRQNEAVIARPHLLLQLNNGINRKVTLVSAAAGFGKTTLVSQWVRKIDRQVAWVSLDSQDNDVKRFCLYVLYALKPCVPELEVLFNEMISFDQMPIKEAVITAVINSISNVQEDIVLVLDDYHLIENDKIHEGVGFLLEYLPQNLHVVITTRKEPKLPLAKLRAKGNLCEIRDQHLKFSCDEISSLFKKFHIQLSSNSISTLEQKTGGWVTGLKLLSLTLQNSKNENHMIQKINGTQRYIVDYLVEEVLEGLTNEVNVFLMKTSILKQMSVPLCEYIMDENTTNYNDLLAELYRSNLFLVSLDDYDEWYRYHPLFVDLLRLKLTQYYNNDLTQINQLYTRASKWYEKNNNFVESFYYAIQANNVLRILELLEMNSSSSHNHEIANIVIQWINGLDQNVLSDYPELYVWKSSLMLLVGQIKGIDILVDKAEKYFLKRNNEDYLGRIATVRATLSLTRYDIPEIIKQASFAIRRLDESNFSYRSSVTWTLGIAHQTTGEYKKAVECYQETLLYVAYNCDYFTKVLALVGMGIAEESIENLEKAERFYCEALDITGEKSLHFVSEAHAGLSRIYLSQKSLDKAYIHASKAVELSKQYDRQIDRYVLCEVQLAKVLIAKGDNKTAIELLENLLYKVKASDFEQRLPEIAEILVKAYSEVGNTAKVIQLSRQYNLTHAYATVILSARELDILKLIADGLSNKEIGQKLFLAIDTVKGHNRKIFEKLEVTNRTEAVAKARAYKLI